MILVSVFDKKAAVYWAPQTFPHNVGAMRAFSQAFQNPESNLAKFPEDFDLYIVGVFDEKSGQVDPVIPPNFLESMINLNYNVKNGNIPLERKNENA